MDLHHNEYYAHLYHNPSTFVCQYLVYTMNGLAMPLTNSEPNISCSLRMGEHRDRPYLRPKEHDPTVNDSTANVQQRFGQQESINY